MKMVFVAGIIGNSLCIIYGFFIFIFSKITFYWKLFSDCCNQFGYPGPLYTCLVDICVGSCNNSDLHHIGLGFGNILLDYQSYQDMVWYIVTNDTFLDRIVFGNFMINYEKVWDM